MLYITADIQIDEGELHETFIRAGGPGGQHVNKVSTGVQLRFDVLNSPSLPPAVKNRLLQLGGQRLTGKGELLIQASGSRSQEQNRREARERLIDLVRKAARKQKRRRPTSPGKAARERRLRGKKQRSTLKRQRQPVGDGDGLA